MRAILLSTILALGLCFASQADVVIYKNKIVYTATGDGGMNRGTVAGWTLYDPGTGEIIHLFANTRARTFFEEIEDYSVLNISGRGQELLVISLGETFTDDFGDLFVNTFTAKGVKTTLDVGSGQLWEIPRTFSLTANYIFTTTSGNLALEEDKGKLVFDRAQTFQSNGAGESLRQAADRLRQSLLDQGYLETT